MATCDFCCNVTRDGLPFTEIIDGIEHGLCRQCGTKHTEGYWKNFMEGEAKNCHNMPNCEECAESETDACN